MFQQGRGRRHRSMTPAAVEESPGADSLGAESPGGIQVEIFVHLAANSLSPSFIARHAE